MSTPAEIRHIADPAQRARAAQGFIDRGSAAIAEVRAIRDVAVLEWRKAATQREIAAELGVTPGLIGQIDSKAKEPTRAQIKAAKAILRRDAAAGRESKPGVVALAAVTRTHRPDRQ